MTDRLTMTSDKGGVAFTFDLDITCEKSEIMKILKVAEKLKAYEEIGTVEECREARERQGEKKPAKDEYNHDCCPNCGWIVCQDEYGGRYLPHCENCGQAIDWSGIE
ncbi:hypothetical protein D7V82_14620 [bacterium 1xD8-6]|nr:hypothetical protein D7V72_16010 [bacterium D16-36]RKI66547.1 hypothetical protein D7V82_14620 [bacterium 1xD8-6]